MRSRLYRQLACVALAASSLALVGCSPSTPAEKTQKYTQHGTELLDKGDLAKAQVEFKNALQINDKYVPALYGMAEIAERTGRWDQMYAFLGRVVELDPKNLAAQLKLGQLLLSAGQLDKAIPVGKALDTLAPENPDVLAFQAALSYKLGDSKKAVDLANAALAKNPKQIAALVVLATERIGAGDYKKGIEYLDTGLKVDGHNVALQLIKAQALEKLSDLAGAEAVFNNLIAQNPKQKQYQAMLAQFYLQHGQKDKAEAQYRKIAAEFPNDAQAQLDVVRLVRELRGPQAAVAELQKLIASNPKKDDLRFVLADLYQSQNNFKEADAIYQEIAAKSSDKAEALKAKDLLAASLLTQGKKPEGQKLIQEVLSEDARNQGALILRAELEINERHLDDAIADLRTVLRDSPNSVQTLALLARAHDLSGAPDLADDYYHRAFEASRHAVPYGMNYATFLMRQNRTSQAESTLQDVLRASPDYVPAMKLLTQLYLRSGDLIRAQTMIEQAKKLNDKGVLANQIQGAVYAAQKDYGDSISALKRAYAASPSDIQPIVALVGIYMQSNKPQEALSFMNSVVQASPDNTEVRLLQAQLLAETNQKAQAQQVYEQVIARDPKSVPAYAGLVGLYNGDKKFDDASRVIDQGLAAAPGDFDLRLMKAGELELTNKVDDAIALYKAILKDRPGTVVVANNLASLLTEYRTDPASIKEAYDIAQQLKGSDIPQFKDTLGWADYKTGKYQDAAPLLASAAEQLQDMGVVQFHLGMNQLALGDKAAAKQSLSKAVDLAKTQPFPQLDQAKKALQGL